MEQRPYLKGVFHFFATIIYILSIPFLSTNIPKSLSSPLWSYLLSVIGHFGASALLHMFIWPENILPYIRKLDHVMIFVKMAGIYYIGISTVMSDINPTVLFIIVTGIISGILMRILFTDLPRFLISIPYILMGWAFILDINTPIRLIERIPMGFLLGVMGGLCYTVGAIIYIKRYPNPYPKYLGYHELFHLISIIGTILFTIAIFGFAVPYHTNSTI